MTGIEHHTWTLYKGVPFAKAKRFEKLELCELDGNQSYTVWPPAAWQGSFEPGTFYDKEFYASEEEPPKSEDCLYLNIYTPKDARNAPVAMWIHGGGFDHGYSYEKEFDGAAFARDGIVLVSVAYRVGIFGFYNRKKDPQHCNLGLQDQAAALKWIYKNIHAFGGDPSQITIFGQSAGCLSAACLLSNPDLQPMIHGAILQSGLGIDGVRELDEADLLMQKFIEENELDEAALRTLPPEDLMEMQKEFLALYPLPFSPCLDGEFLTARFEEIDLPDIPLLFGSTYNDD